MSRPDLLALTAEAIASLANMGLVKRAQRELTEGSGPALAEEDDGTVVGRYADGVLVRLPVGVPLKETACTCGAAGICRHRVAVALAYAAWHASAHDGSAAPDLDWSPAEIDDTTLERAIGSRMVTRARSMLKIGFVATLEHDGIPSVKLPSCTVRFLVPHDVAYARCDCAMAGGACEHLALAVWAFRARPDMRASSAVQIVAVGGEASARANEHGEALEDASSLLKEVLSSGIGEGSPPPARFAKTRLLLERARMTWMRSIVGDLEIALEGYRKRSALYGTREVAALLVELAARARAGARTDHELPPRFVLGEDEAPETLLDHVRLISLGARVRADDRSRFVEVFLADTDTQLVLVLQKRWDFASDEDLQEGPDLARRLVAQKVRLDAIAHGQIVSKVVTRHANRSIVLGTSRAAQTSVTPQAGDWNGLRAPLLVRDLALHGEALGKRAPRMLRPRVLAENVHVVAVSEVRNVFHSAAEQQVVAELVDEGGQSFSVVLRHRRAAPHALDAVVAALAQPVKFVSGELLRRGARWEVEPLAVVGSKLVVPDLAQATSSSGAPAYVRTTRVDPVENALTRLEAVLEELCNTGFGPRAHAAMGRADIVAKSLDDAGLFALASRLRDVVKATDTQSAIDAWIDTSVRATLTRDAM